MDDLKRMVNAATPDDPETVRTVVSTYEMVLSSAPRSSSTSRKLRWQYYGLIADLLDETAVQHGWRFYKDLLTTYSPRDEFGVPASSHVLANGVGR